MKFYCICIVLAEILLFSSCGDSFEYSPYQTSNKHSRHNLNEKNLQKLLAASADDTIAIAFVSDSQRFYDEVDAFVNKANHISSVDFILLAGDISDFGLLTEFELIEEKLSRLNKPYFGIVGNHDLLGKGNQVFERMFGALNWSFVYGNVKFVLHNTNGKESSTGNVPDIGWLKDELVQSDSVTHFITISHIPPFDQDFDKSLEGAYASLLAETPGLMVSLHGHIHRYTDGYPYLDNVRYITSHPFNEKRFLLLKINKGSIDTQIIEY